MDAMTRKAYPGDGSAEEWAFVAPYLRDVANGLRSMLCTGAPWRIPPNDVPPWHVVYQQTQRWLKAGVVEQMAPDCACCCAKLPTAHPSRVPSSWTAERCNRRQKAGDVPATMGTIQSS